LKAVRLFQDMTPEQLSAIEEKCRWVDLQPGEVILDRGDKSRDVFFLVSGTVRVMNYLGGDREVAFADLAAGDVFGAMSALDSMERSARVAGSEQCLLAAIPAADFRALLLRHPQAALRLCEDFARIIRAMDRRVVSLASLTTRQRVYAELLRLAVPNPRGDGSWMITVAPHHNEIASWAGTTKEEVATAIGGLVRDGIIERKFKTLVIKDHARLHLMATMQ
jgi:CRP-like cAMP-binding protein